MDLKDKMKCADLLSHNITLVDSNELSYVSRYFW
jgi:hypothetical protein